MALLHGTQIDLGDALGHPNVIRVLGACPKPSLGLVLELLDVQASWKELGLPPTFDTCTRDTYLPGTSFSPEGLLTTLRGVAAACAHLHAKGFTHGDLYAHNTMFNAATGEAKVGDFGAAYNYEPLGPAAALLIERLEVRAFGCLAEELLHFMRAREGVGVVMGSNVEEIISRCKVTDVAARPSFATLVTQLAIISIK